MRIHFRASLVLLVIALAAAGCTDPAPSPVDVAGKILLDSKPMPDGDIYFQPTDGAVPLQTKISDGHYSLKTRPGEYRVMINQYRDHGKKNAYGKPQMDSTVPARYNVDSKLTATVSANSPNAIDFNIESK